MMSTCIFLVMTKFKLISVLNFFCNNICPQIKIMIREADHYIAVIFLNKQEEFCGNLMTSSIILAKRLRLNHQEGFWKLLCNFPQLESIY